MHLRHPLAIVLLASIVTLAVGFGRTPLWDEDEPRFASIARTMVETGDWILPMYNGAMSIDKPALMSWCMAIGYTLFGDREFSARVPAAVATLLTVLALLRAGTKWFDATTGTIAPLAFVGCLLVGIEAHAATPDAILVALTTWSTVLAVEPILAISQRVDGRIDAPDGLAASLPTLSVRRAVIVGGLLGLGVLCKGPIGFVGPMAVVLSWVWLLAIRERRASMSTTRLAIGRLLETAAAAAWDALRSQRLGVVFMAMVAMAAPWYVAVGLRTGGAWPAGFFLVHNVGRFVAPMEKHSGGVLYHPLTMLVGFYPWSCFLPLAVVVGAWRVWRRAGSDSFTNAILLLLVWMSVWIGGFSAAATKLPNYVLPAYPAAALLVAALAVDASRRAEWPHPRWLASGLGWLAFGGLATAATVLVGSRFGLAGAAPATLVGLVPIAGAAATLWLARSHKPSAIAAFTITALLYTGLLVGPAAQRISTANLLPGLVHEAHALAGGKARLAVVGILTPNVVYYAGGVVQEWNVDQPTDVVAFLESGPDAMVLISEDAFAGLRASLPRHVAPLARARPLFENHDILVVGTTTIAEQRTAHEESTLR